MGDAPTNAKVLLHNIIQTMTRLGGETRTTYLLLIGYWSLRLGLVIENRTNSCPETIN